MEVWTHEVDGYMVTTYTHPSQAVLDILRTDTVNRPYLNRFEGGSLDIPLRQVGVSDPPVYETVPRAEWLVIQKAAQDARDAAAKQARIDERRVVRQAAAQALRDAKAANKLGLDPKTDRIIITDTVATTLNQLSAGGLTAEGEAV